MGFSQELLSSPCLEIRKTERILVVSLLVAFLVVPIVSLFLPSSLVWTRCELTSESMLLVPLIVVGSVTMNVLPVSKPVSGKGGWVSVNDRTYS